MSRGFDERKARRVHGRPGEADLDPVLTFRQSLATSYVDGLTTPEQQARAEELLRTDNDFRDEVRVQREARDLSLDHHFLRPSGAEAEQIWRRVIGTRRRFGGPGNGAGVVLLAIGLAVCGR